MWSHAAASLSGLTTGELLSAQDDSHPKHEDNVKGSLWLLAGVSNQEQARDPSWALAACADGHGTVSGPVGLQCLRFVAPCTDNLRGNRLPESGPGSSRVRARSREYLEAAAASCANTPGLLLPAARPLAACLPSGSHPAPFPPALPSSSPPALLCFMASQSPSEPPAGSAVSCPAPGCPSCCPWSRRWSPPNRQLLGCPCNGSFWTMGRTYPCCGELGKMG